MSDRALNNTAEGRHKTRNLRRVVDPKDPYRVVALQGGVGDITTDGADQNIDHLAQKYLGVESYPMRQPGEQRVKVTIRPYRILMQPPAEAG